jgi:hypothetical protein
MEYLPAASNLPALDPMQYGLPEIKLKNDRTVRQTGSTSYSFHFMGSQSAFRPHVICAKMNAGAAR